MTFVRPQMGCIWAKIGLTRQLDKNYPRNYLQPWIVYHDKHLKLYPPEFIFIKNKQQQQQQQW